MVDPKTQMDEIQLITDEGKIVTVTCEFEHIDEMSASIRDYVTTGKIWTDAIVPGNNNIEYMGMNFTWLNMRRIIGVRS